jgi:uncharacterized protein YjbJ (UPF0337 family)
VHLNLRCSTEKEAKMNWDQIAGKWSQLKGSARQHWGRLTDDDLEVIAGSKDKLVGRIQERYGVAKEEAQMQFDSWCKTVRLPEAAPSHSAGRAAGAQGRSGEKHASR